MSQALAHLPPQVRQQVESMLSKLPEATRQQVLNSPMLQKIIARAEQEMQSGGGAKIASVARAAQRATESNLAPRPTPQGHYNGTIQPGDRVSLRGWIVLLVVLGSIAWIMSQL
ncbi:hypothetical protein [Arenimonas sp.]|uniref:hypothetical protein n=1 Tax=Arenimonas sp. TaxID=1872635 RepID=UPI0039E7094E